MANEGRDIVLFLASGKLYLYAGSGVAALDFPTESVSDMDVKNNEAVNGLVTEFIQKNALTPAQIFFVLSESVCFSKDFAIADPANTTGVESDVQNFIEAIPFNTVLSKIYKTATTIRAVGVNQDLVDIVLDAFIAKGFGLTALVPANIYPKYGGENELTPDFAKDILGNKEIAVTGSMVGVKAIADGHEISATKAKGKPTGIRLYILIGVFLLGIIVLAVLLLTRGG